MERKRKKDEVKYFAVDDDGNKFPICYGKGMGNTFFSDNIEKIARYIAYYTHRWYPTLMVIENGKTRAAKNSEQRKFNEVLNYEFFFHETK
jgi:hypothetical protein